MGISRPLWPIMALDMVTFFSSVSFITDHLTLTFVHPYEVSEGKTNFRV